LLVEEFAAYSPLIRADSARVRSPRGYSLPTADSKPVQVPMLHDICPMRCRARIRCAVRS